MPTQRKAGLKRFFAEATKMKGRHLYSYYRFTPAENDGETSLSLVSLASKKAVDKRAVRRNRARRRLREAMRAICIVTPPETTALTIEWVAMAGRAAIAGDWDLIKREVETHWTFIRTAAKKRAIPVASQEGDSQTP